LADTLALHDALPISKTNTVGDDAAAETVQLVDGADHAVTLELVELLPDDRVADAGGRLDDLVFVEFVAAIEEQVVENERVDEVRDRKSTRLNSSHVK